jgi:hypothetical protein
MAEEGVSLPGRPAQPGIEEARRIGEQIKRCLGGMEAFDQSCHLREGMLQHFVEPAIKGLDQVLPAGMFRLQALAKGLVAAGVSRLVVAGGETSGAVVGALEVTALRIGPEIDPGVPWTASVGKPLLLALKSGNFGAPDFFTKAFQLP